MSSDDDDVVILDGDDAEEEMVPPSKMPSRRRKRTVKKNVDKSNEDEVKVREEADENKNNKVLMEGQKSSGRGMVEEDQRGEAAGEDGNDGESVGKKKKKKGRRKVRIMEDEDRRRRRAERRRRREEEESASGSEEEDDDDKEEKVDPALTRARSLQKLGKRSAEEKDRSIKKFAMQVRILQMLAALFSMIIITITRFEDDSDPPSFDISWREIPEFKFFVGVACFVILYAMLSSEDYLLRMYFFCAPKKDDVAERAYDAVRIDHILQGFRVFMDYLLLFLTLAAVVATAVRCSQDAGAGTAAKLCKESNKFVAIVAMFIVSAFFLLTSFLETKRVREQHQAEIDLFTRSVIRRTPSRLQLYFSQSNLDIVKESNEDADEDGGIEMAEMKEEPAENNERRRRKKRPNKAKEDDGAEDDMEKGAKKKKNKNGGIPLAVMEMAEETQGHFQTSRSCQIFTSSIVNICQVALSIYVLLIVLSNKLKVSLVAGSTAYTQEISFHHFSDFQFLVAVCVTSGLYAVFSLGIKVFKSMYSPEKKEINSFEAISAPFRFLFDAVFCFLSLCAGTLVLIVCQINTSLITGNLCDSDDNYPMAGYLTIALGALYLISTVLSWTRWLRIRAFQRVTKEGRMDMAKDSLHRMSSRVTASSSTYEEGFTDLIREVSVVARYCPLELCGVVYFILSNSSFLCCSPSISPHLSPPFQ